MRPYRVTLSRAGCATMELTILAVDPEQARGACAWLEADGWRFLRAELLHAATAAAPSGRPGRPDW